MDSATVEAVNVTGREVDHIAVDPVQPILHVSKCASEHLWPSPSAPADADPTPAQVFVADVRRYPLRGPVALG